MRKKDQREHNLFNFTIQYKNIQKGFDMFDGEFGFRKVCSLEGIPDLCSAGILGRFGNRIHRAVRVSPTGFRKALESYRQPRIKQKHGDVHELLTMSRIYFKHTLMRVSMNSVSNSPSVNHGPPVNATDGVSPSSIYILRVGCWSLVSTDHISRKFARTWTDGTFLISFFCSNVLIERSRTVWWKLLLAFKCFTHIPKINLS